MGGGNVQPGPAAGAGEVEVLGTAAAAAVVVVDTDGGGAAADGASLGWSRRGHEGNRDLLAVLGEWAPG